MLLKWIAQQQTNTFRSMWTGHRGVAWWWSKRTCRDIAPAHEKGSYNDPGSLLLRTGTKLLPTVMGTFQAGVHGEIQATRANIHGGTARPFQVARWRRDAGLFDHRWPKLLAHTPMLPHCNSTTHCIHEQIEGVHTLPLSMLLRMTIAPPPNVYGTGILTCSPFPDWTSL